MTSVKGIALFIAQGWGKPGWETLEQCAKSAAGLGYDGLQVPLWNDGPIDVELAATSTDYCQEQQGIATEAGCPIVELANHVEGQLVRCGAAYQPLFRGFAPKEIRGNWNEVTAWAQNRLKLSAKTTRNFGFDRVATFPGTSIFHTGYEWPQRPKGLVNAAFNALANAWRPVFETGDEVGVQFAFELHPMEELMDGSTFNRFKDHIGDRKSAKILADLSHRVLAGATQENMEAFIRNHADDIIMWHVKDGEFIPTGESDAYGSYLPWQNRPGAFRSTGDGQIDHQRIFDLVGRELKLPVWATVEWECKTKGWSQGVREAVEFCRAWLNQTQIPERTAAEVTNEVFDDFVGGGGIDLELISEILGIPVSEVDTSEPIR
jgi:sugar phosphate isomerase/epimerase